MFEQTKAFYHGRKVTAPYKKKVDFFYFLFYMGIRVGYAFFKEKNESANCI
jgi:hypothetical protein